ncbi:MAG: EAL domain-containing protein [Rhodospirillaceae bacterium]|nr:EAL domain-containing protein [Rhodospirillaceae bacterium]
MTAGEKGCGACGKDVVMPPFQMAFQPIVDISKRRVYGYEALVRGPEGQSASSVLSQINNENRYAFDQACRVMAIEQAAALGLDRKLSINFLPNAVYEPKACIKATLTAARKVHFPLDLITFEITEDERIRDTKHLQGIISEYRNHGFRVALDDFGAEYAGLNSLSELHVDAIKLDIAMVRNIDQDTRRRKITLGMIRVCQDLDIDVVAEGVERVEELSILRDAGVRYVQGYLLARPALNVLVRDEAVAYA